MKKVLALMAIVASICVFCHLKCFADSIVNNQNTKISTYGTYDKHYYNAAQSCKDTIAVGVPFVKVYDCFASEIVNPINYQNGSVTGTIPCFYAAMYKPYTDMMEAGTTLGSGGTEIALQNFYIVFTSAADELRRTGGSKILQTKESVAKFLYGIEPPKKVLPHKQSGQ